MNRVDLRLLAEFLDHPDRPDGTLRFHELQGFLFAIACSPETIAPSEWLPIVAKRDSEFRGPGRGRESPRPGHDALQRGQYMCSRAKQFTPDRVCSSSARSAVMSPGRPRSLILATTATGSSRTSLRRRGCRSCARSPRDRGTARWSTSGRSRGSEGRVPPFGGSRTHSCLRASDKLRIWHNVPESLSHALEV